MIQFKNKLKQLFTFVVSLMMFSTLLQSCAELDPDLTEFNAPPGSYESLADQEEGIVGVYQGLFTAARFNDIYAPAWGGDDMTTNFGANKADFREFDQRNVTPGNARLGNNWNNSLNIINRANTVISRSQGLFQLDVDMEIVELRIGEAFFLRGLMLQHLSRIHGRIPILLDPVVDPDVTLSSQQEVFEQVESDFLEAERLLPDVYPGVNPGAPRPNKGTARALLARLYMDWAGFPLNDMSKYAAAAQSAKQVIDNSGAHGFLLLSDLEDLWRQENASNTEGVFSITFCSSCPNLDNRKYGILGLPADLLGWQESLAEIKFFEDFPVGPRKEATYRTELQWEAFSDQKNPVFKKITGPAGDIAQFSSSRFDFWMRYAEVLLIYAEASGRSGNVTPQSWEALNMIRRRAEGLPFATPNPSVDLTSGDIAELAVTERKWEFAGEFSRWYDLVRLQRVEQALSDRQPQVSTDPATGAIINERNSILGSLGTDNYYAPLPQIALDELPNLAN